MRRLPLVTVLLVLATSVAQGQDRRLYWPSVTVEARLDADGRLHVREEQRIALTGDWNGAQRQFRVRLGQQLTLHRLVRIGPDGVEHALRLGDLSEVDEFAWVEERTLRWRSRLPSDPPFDNAELVYVLEYTYDNILQPRGGEYALDHDFAFANRDDVVEQFTLRLELDPTWAAPGGFTGAYQPVALSPGEGYVVRVPLQYLGAGRPAGVDFGAGALPRYALAALLLIAVSWLVLRLYGRERALGRFAPLHPVDAIDETWLAEHVFNVRPEVVGAAWDDTTGAPEVAAVLARLVGEGKMKSWVDDKGFWVFREHILHLELLVDRNRLDDYERRLIDALFDPGATVTSTQRVRERYKQTGFDPASKISASLQRAVRALGRGGHVPDTPHWAPSLVLGLTGIALMIVGAVRRPADVPVMVVSWVVGILLFVVGSIMAAFWRKRVYDLFAHAAGFLIPVALLTIGPLILLLSGRPRTGVWMLAGLTAFVLALINSLLNQARMRQSLTLLARRRELAAAREYFKAELAKREPRLRDEWFPYLIAFGLGPQMDRWFRAFGGEVTHASSMSYAGVSTGSSSGGSGGGSWTGFGGGGGFAGGGASSAWISAAGTMASGVSAPSSSSGGGSGGGGGGSSGGGGGGGW
ncbi:MAG TPA: hypothetical protein VF178_08910 [Gemmatimonadaceae bacterium]